jgi:phosphoglycolate phosphatase-like HAD superfamily hydrolase
VATPALLVLDFDGVVCDGRPEYFATAWRAYAAAWPAPRPGRPEAVAERFASLRPLIESGWEMPLLVHALLAGEPDDAVKDRHAWLATAARLLAASGVTAETLGRALNRVRDDWFAADPGGWLAHHRFYPGVVERLVALADGPSRVAIVTTKAARFVRALLEAQDRRLAAVPVVGREPGRPMPKPDILGRLAAEARLADGAAGLWFVEDLLETLDATAARPELAGARLFLAEWGYNTLEDRARAGAGRRIAPLSLARFAGPLEAWP